MPFKTNVKSFVLITGASKGFGQAIAARFAEVLGLESHFVLLGRDEKGLETTERMILGWRDGGAECTSKGFTVSAKSMDLVGAKTEDFVGLFAGDDVSTGDFRQVIIIHNAGSVGDVSKSAIKIRDPGEVSDYFSLNLSSTIALNSAFLEFAKEVDDKVIVHVTSICGIKPFKNMGLYGAGKAARDMFFQVLALEEPKLQVLGWSPGPLEGTEMSVKVRTETGDAATREMFEQLFKTNSYVRCDDSANKMIETLVKNDFASGAHVDYFD